MSDHRRKLPGLRLHHSGLHLGVQVEEDELAEELTQALSEPGKVEAVQVSQILNDDDFDGADLKRLLGIGAG